MYCKYCGEEIDSKEKVCPVCGTEISAEEAENESSAEVNSSRSERQAKLDEIKERRDMKRKKEQKKKLIAVGVLVAIIIAAAGGVLAWLNVKFGDQVEIEPPKQTEVPVYSPTNEPVTASPEATAEPVPIAEASPSAVPTVTPVPSQSVNAEGEPLVTAVPRVTETATQKPAATTKPKATAMPKTSSAVKMGFNIQNKYVRLENIYVSKTTGIYIMSFRMGDTVYYANVNKGTTTSQIKNKYYYITAHPTEAVYNGKPVYEITSMSTKKPASTTAAKTAKPSASTATSYTHSGDYVLSNSASGYVTDAQLSKLSSSELNIAKNEIYARHGRKFKNEALQKYFESKSWYKVNPDYNYANDSANLTQLEKTNLLKILNYQK